MRRLNVAVVGLRFGAEFAPIYADHPAVTGVALCDLRPDLLAVAASHLPVIATYGTLEEVLADPNIDAVHLATPIPLHGSQSIACLRAGKHVASAVPATTDLAEMSMIQQLQASTGLTYMLMETAVYTREFLQVEQMVKAGEFGRLTYACGAHHQDMEGWPEYWSGIPPMYYSTHVIGPLFTLLGGRALSVRCLGSGRLPMEKQQRWANPFPVETALFRIDGTDAVAEVTRSLFQTTRQYTESFSLFGDRLGYEWRQLEEEQDNLFFRHSQPGDGFDHPDGEIIAERRRAPDVIADLPEALRPYSRGWVEHIPCLGMVKRGGNHWGSHPHLVHEFVSSITEGRPPRVDATRAAEWTAAAIYAHESALQGGVALKIPQALDGCLDV